MVSDLWTWGISVLNILSYRNITAHHDHCSTVKREQLHSHVAFNSVNTAAAPHALIQPFDYFPQGPPESRISVTVKAAGTNHLRVSWTPSEDTYAGVLLQLSAVGVVIHFNV